MSDQWNALIELATKVAELPAPDRDIDVLIWQAIEDDAPKNLLSWTPEFTQIIDDALKVVPFGPHWRWLLDKRPYADSGRPDGYRAHVTLSGLIDPVFGSNRHQAKKFTGRTISPGLSAMSARPACRLDGRFVVRVRCGACVGTSNSAPSYGWRHFFCLCA